MKSNVTPSDFEFLSVIGRGYFGKVSKVRYKGDSQIYALKTIKKSKLKEQKHIEHIKNERKILFHCSRQRVKTTKTLSYVHSQDIRRTISLVSNIKI